MVLVMSPIVEYWSYLALNLASRYSKVFPSSDIELLHADVDVDGDVVDVREGGRVGEAQVLRKLLRSFEQKKNF